MAEKLRECPFCGSRAVVVDCGAEDGNPNAGGVTVECVACRASAPVAFGENAHNAVHTAWNRRAEPVRGEDVSSLGTLRHWIDSYERHHASGETVVDYLHARLDERAALTREPPDGGGEPDWKPQGGEPTQEPVDNDEAWDTWRKQKHALAKVLDDFRDAGGDGYSVALEIEALFGLWPPCASPHGTTEPTVAQERVPNGGSEMSDYDTYQREQRQRLRAWEESP